MPKIIDLSVSVSPKGNLKVKPQIVYRTHEDTPKVLGEMYGLKPEEFPDGK